MKELKTRFQKYVDSGSIASRAVESVWRYLLLLVPALFLAALCAGCGQGNALSRRVYWTDVLNHKSRELMLTAYAVPPPMRA